MGLLPKAVSPEPSPLFQRMCLSSRPRMSGTQSFMLSLPLQGKPRVRVSNGRIWELGFVGNPGLVVSCGIDMNWGGLWVQCLPQP